MASRSTRCATAAGWADGVPGASPGARGRGAAAWADSLNIEMSTEPVTSSHIGSLELSVEELLGRARPLPPHEEMLIDDLSEAEGVAFLAALEA